MKAIDPNLLRRGGIKAEFTGRAGAAELRKALRDPTGWRRFLNQRRKDASAEEEVAIWKALFALYGIPEEWPAEIRLEWLAGRLAAELFPRCQALWKPHGGGPSAEHQAKMLGRKTRLFKKFEAYRRAHDGLSHLRAAALFMKDEKIKKACAAAGFTRPKSFAQAMKELSSETPV